MDVELADELLVVLVMHMDSGVTGEPLVDWATSALERGLDSPALTWLAGLSRSCSVFESAPLLDRALRELSLPPLPDPEGLRRAYVSAVSRQLLAGKLTPNEALDRVHRHAVSPLNHPADLAPWCFTWEGLDHTDYRTLTEAETADHARQLAARWAGETIWP